MTKTTFENDNLGAYFLVLAIPTKKLELCLFGTWFLNILLVKPFGLEIIPKAQSFVSQIRWSIFFESRLPRFGRKVVPR